MYANAYRALSDWTAAALPPVAAVNVATATTVADETAADDVPDDGCNDDRETVYHMLVDWAHYAVWSDLRCATRTLESNIFF